MTENNPLRSWFVAWLVCGVPIALFDAFYVMPNYVIGYSSSLMSENALLSISYSYLKWLVGIFAIIGAIFAGGIQFGPLGANSFISSSFVMYTIYFPIAIFKLFIIEGKGGVPPAYRFFQFFIARSGAKYVDAESFDAPRFVRTVDQPRSDQYQAKLEAQELEAAAKRARKKADEIEVRTTAKIKAEASRLRAAKEAADAAERKAKAKARERMARKLYD